MYIKFVSIKNIELFDFHSLRGHLVLKFMLTFFVISPTYSARYVSEPVCVACVCLSCANQGTCTCSVICLVKVR